MRQAYSETVCGYVMHYPALELIVVKKNRRVCDSFLDMLNCPVNSTFLRKICNSLPAMMLFHELTIVKDNG